MKRKKIKPVCRVHQLQQVSVSALCFFLKKEKLFLSMINFTFIVYTLFSLQRMSVFFVFFLSLMFTHQRDKNSKSNER